MTDQGKKYLSDILQAIELIESFTIGISDYSEYLSDLKTQSAVERQLGIVGEAVKSANLLIILPDEPDKPYKSYKPFESRIHILQIWNFRILS